MKNLWFIFIGMLIVFILFFISFTNFTFDGLGTKPISEKVQTQVSTTQKTTNKKHVSTINTTKKSTQSKISLSDDEQLYEEEIAAAYSEENKVKHIQERSIKSSILNTNSATKVKIKIKAKERDGIVKAKISIAHDMLTYAQAKKKGVEVNFITHITGLVAQRVVYDASTSQFLSKNPLIKFSFKGKKDEELTIIYQQLKGETFYASKKIK